MHTMYSYIYSIIMFLHLKYPDDTTVRDSTRSMNSTLKEFIDIQNIRRKVTH